MKQLKPLIALITALGCAQAIAGCHMRPLAGAAMAPLGVAHATQAARGVLRVEVTEPASKPYHGLYLAQTDWDRVEASLSNPADAPSLQTVTASATLDPGAGTRHAALQFTGFPPGVGYRLSVRLLRANPSGAFDMLASGTQTGLTLIGDAGTVRVVLAPTSQGHLTINPPQPALADTLVATLAGNALPAVPADGPAATLTLPAPAGVAYDAAGNLFFTDGSNRIRKLAPGGTVTTLAGGSAPGFADGAGANARFSAPGPLAFDSSGNLYVADGGNNAIRRITPAGVVTTLAGSPAAGFIDATGASARFANPQGLALDPNDNLFVADSGNNAIRRVTPTGAVTTFAGTNLAGFVNATGTAARFANPCGLAFGPGNLLYVADTNNTAIRRIDSTGAVTTLAGTNTAGYRDSNGGLTPLFNAPTGLAVAASGNVIVADANNHLIRSVTPAGVVSTIAGVFQTVCNSTVGTPMGGYADGSGQAVRLNRPSALAFDASGCLAIADRANNRLRSLAPGGAVTTLAGNGEDFAYASGARANTQFSAPLGLAIDAAGTLYVADSNNNRVRKVAPDGSVSLLAGNGVFGILDGPANQAEFATPGGLAVDAAGNVYVNDNADNTIRKIAPNGTVTSLAGAGQVVGNGCPGSSTGYIDATGSAARLDTAYAGGLAIDPNGNLFVADLYNHCIRKVTPAGVVTTVAGSPTPGATDGTGTAARFNLPSDIQIAADGTLYVVDAGNHAIRQIAMPGAVVTTLAGGTQGFADGSGTAARFDFGAQTGGGLAIDAAGTLYVADTNNNAIRRVTRAGAVSTIAGGPGGASDRDGDVASAQFWHPIGIVVDRNGTIYVSDQANTIRRLR